MSEDATRNQDAASLRRQEIEYEEIKERVRNILPPQRLSDRWLRTRSDSVLRDCRSLWLLEFNLHCNATSGARFERVEEEMRTRGLL
jgi:hypothetical protein